MTPARDWKYLRWCIAGADIFSTCTRRHFMAIVVAGDGRVVGTGFNGSPPGFGHCTDGFCPRGRSEVAHGSAYDNADGLCIAVHAEANALLYSDRTARAGGALYVNGPPCWGCGLLIAGSGLKRLVYLEDPAFAAWPRVEALLGEAGIVTLGFERDSP